jgi:hypothetical protein
VIGNLARRRVRTSARASPTAPASSRPSWAEIRPLRKAAEQPRSASPWKARSVRRRGRRARVAPRAAAFCLLLFGGVPDRQRGHRSHQLARVEPSSRIPQVPRTRSRELRCAPRQLVRAATPGSLSSHALSGVRERRSGQGRTHGGALPAARRGGKELGRHRRWRSGLRLWEARSFLGYAAFSACGRAPRPLPGDAASGAVPSQRQRRFPPRPSVGRCEACGILSRWGLLAHRPPSWVTAGLAQRERWHARGWRVTPMASSAREARCGINALEGLWAEMFGRHIFAN